MPKRHTSRAQPKRDPAVIARELCDIQVGDQKFLAVLSPWQSVNDDMREDDPNLDPYDRVVLNNARLESLATALRKIVKKEPLKNKDKGSIRSSLQVTAMIKAVHAHMRDQHKKSSQNISQGTDHIEQDLDRAGAAEKGKNFDPSDPNTQDNRRSEQLDEYAKETAILKTYDESVVPLLHELAQSLHLRLDSDRGHGKK